MEKEFVIATNVEYDDPLKYDLHNLKIRLKIQKEWVAKTEAEIENIEELLEQRKKTKHLNTKSNI